jgi:hypothetical protein
MGVMNLGIIDKDEYRQYHYWDTFQKLLLPGAAGFTVAAALLEGRELRILSGVVAGLFWLLFLAAVVMAWQLGRHMLRELPASLQSLLLFSEDPGEEPPPARLVEPRAQET